MQLFKIYFNQKVTLMIEETETAEKIQNDVLYVLQVEVIHTNGVICQ